MDRRTVAGITFTTRNASTVEDGTAGENIAGWIGVNTFAVA